jgi:hypothetical protein
MASKSAPQATPPTWKAMAGNTDMMGRAANRILDPSNGEALTNRTIQKAVENSNAQYGARGLAGSGIAQKGAEQAGTDAALQGEQLNQQGILGVLQAGSGNTSFGPAPTPRGLFGLK